MVRMEWRNGTWVYPKSCNETLNYVPVAAGKLMQPECEVGIEAPRAGSPVWPEQCIDPRDPLAYRVFVNVESLGAGRDSLVLV